MENLIVICILLAVTAGAIRYILRAKKRGETCIGCPHAKQCGGRCSCATEHSDSKRIHE